MHRDARLLKAKALASLRRCARAFNDFDDDGRVSTVLLHLQHSFEMLLKASLIEKTVRVFDKRKGRSIGFDKTVNVSQSRTMVEAGKKAGATIVYVEIPGGSHGDVAAPQFGPMLDFFVKQSRRAE